MSTRLLHRPGLLLTFALLSPSVAAAGPFGPSNYWECILKNMPGAQNRLAAAQVAQSCQSDFPDGYNYVVPPKDKVGGLFTVPRARDCFLKHGKSVSDQIASQLIWAACNQLYFE